MNQLSFHSYQKLKPWANFEFTSFIVSSINEGVQTVKIHKKWSFSTRLAAAMDQSIIDNAIDEWCRRLRACVGASVGHFEQLLW